MIADSGTVLLCEGSRTNVLYILISGELEVLKDHFQVDTVSQPGTLFGEVSVLLDTPHMATVRVLQPSRIYRIERAEEFLSAHPEIVLELARLLAYRLNRSMNFLVDLKRHCRGLAGVLIGMAIQDQESLGTLDGDESDDKLTAALSQSAFNL